MIRKSLFCLMKISRMPSVFRFFIIGLSLFCICFSSSFIFSTPFQCTVASISLMISESNDKFAETKIYSNQSSSDISSSFYYDYLEMTSIRDTSNVRKYNQGRISKVILENSISSVVIDEQIFNDLYIVSTPKNYSIRNDEFYFSCEALTKHKFYTYNNQSNSCAISKSLANQIIGNNEFDSLIGHKLMVNTDSGHFIYSIQCVFDGMDSYCGEKSIVIKDTNSADSIFEKNNTAIYLDLVKAEKCVSKYLSFVLDNNYFSSTLVFQNGTSTIEHRTIDIYKSYVSSKENAWLWTLHIVVLLISFLSYLIFSIFYHTFIDKKKTSFVMTMFLSFLICFSCSFLPINTYFVNYSLHLLISYSFVPVFIVLLLLIAIKLFHSYMERKKSCEN